MLRETRNTMHIDPLVVFFRWLHVITACIVIGCAFFMTVLLPAGLRGLEDAQSEPAFLRSRRALKMVIHTGILLFIISGVYNYLVNRELYQQWPKMTQSVFGIHVLGAAIAWTIMIAFLAGREPFRGYRTWMKINIVVLILTVAAASTLKSAREAVIKSMIHPASQTNGRTP